VESVVREKRKDVNEIDAFDREIGELAEGGFEAYLLTGESVGSRN
jgi:hypothetical protein